MSNHLPAHPEFDWSKPPSTVQITRQNQQITFSSGIKDPEQITYGLLGVVGILGFVGYIFSQEVLEAPSINGVAVFGMMLAIVIGITFLIATLIRIFGKVALTIDIQEKEVQVYSGWAIFSSNKTVPLAAIEGIKEKSSSNRDKEGREYVIKSLVIEVQGRAPIEFGDKLGTTEINYFEQTLQQILADRAAGKTDHYLTDDLSQHLIE